MKISPSTKGKEVQIENKKIKPSEDEGSPDWSLSPRGKNLRRRKNTPGKKKKWGGGRHVTLSLPLQRKQKVARRAKTGPARKPAYEKRGTFGGKKTWWGGGRESKGKYFEISL